MIQNTAKNADNLAQLDLKYSVSQFDYILAKSQIGRDYLFLELFVLSLVRVANVSNMNTIDLISQIGVYLGKIKAALIAAEIKCKK